MYTGKSCDKIQHSFLKTLRKLGQEGKFLSVIQGITKKPIRSIE